MALAKVTTSEAFGKAERPARFLRHLVETALSHDAHNLKESVLGTDVFDRPATWDPRLDPVVRQEATRLRKRLAKYYATAGVEDKVLIGLPVGSYVPVFRQRPAAIVVTAVEPPPVRRRLRWSLPVVVIFLIAAAALSWRSVRLEPSLSIAVLPFLNSSGDPADQYFADGLTDEVADSLARFKSLRVTARSSAALFKKQPRDLVDIARQLHVSHLLEASIERSGEQLNIVASLSRAADGAKIWTDRYQRHTADLSAIQTDLAEAVRGSLGVAAAPGQKRPIPPNDAHDHYLKGRFEAFQATPESNLQAEADYRRAIEIDPDYAPAYAGLASAIWNQNIWANQSPLLEERRKAEELWQKALQVDAGLVAAHSGLAAYAMQYDWDWTRAERELRAVLSAGENSGAESNYAFLCLVLGRRTEAEQHRARANDLDPVSPGSLLNNAQFLLLENRLAEARDEYQKVVSRNNSSNAKLALYSVMAEQGESQAAMKGLLALPQNLASVQMGLAQAKAMAGAREEALRILTPLEEHYRENRMFMNDFAIAYAALGDEANAIEWMAMCLDSREYSAIYIRVDPMFAQMQNNPAFRALKKRMNLDW